MTRYIFILFIFLSSVVFAEDYYWFQPPYESDTKSSTPQEAATKSLNLVYGGICVEESLATLTFRNEQSYSYLAFSYPECTKKTTYRYIERGGSGCSSPKVLDSETGICAIPPTENCSDGYKSDNSGSCDPNRLPSFCPTGIQDSKPPQCLPAPQPCGTSQSCLEDIAVTDCSPGDLSNACITTRSDRCFDLSGNEISCSLDMPETNSCPDGYFAQIGTINDVQVTNCAKQPARVCQSGYTFDSSIGYCKKNNICPNTHSFNPVSQTCQPNQFVEHQIDQGGEIVTTVTTLDTSTNTRTVLRTGSNLPDSSSSNDPGQQNDIPLTEPGSDISPWSPSGELSDFSDISEDVQTAKDNFYDGFDTIKSEASEVLSIEVNQASGGLQDVVIPLPWGEAVIPFSDFSDVMDEVGSAIVMIATVVALFLVFG